MKNMSDRKMGMGKGGPSEDGYFPSEPHHKVLERVGEIKGFKYPDTEEAVRMDSEQAVRATNKNLPKAGFRN